MDANPGGCRLERMETPRKMWKWDHGTMEGLKSEGRHEHPTQPEQRTKDHAAITGKEDKKTKKPNAGSTNLRPQNRRAEWLATGSARFTSLFYDYGKCSIFAVNRPC